LAVISGCKLQVAGIFLLSKPCNLALQPETLPPYNLQLPPYNQRRIAFIFKGFTQQNEEKEGKSCFLITDFTNNLMPFTSRLQ